MAKAPKFFWVVKGKGKILLLLTLRLTWPVAQSNFHTTEAYLEVSGSEPPHIIHSSTNIYSALLWKLQLKLQNPPEPNLGIPAQAAASSVFLNQTMAPPAMQLWTSVVALAKWKSKWGYLCHTFPQGNSGQFFLLFSMWWGLLKTLTLRSYRRTERTWWARP